MDNNEKMINEAAGLMQNVARHWFPGHPMGDLAQKMTSLYSQVAFDVFTKEFPNV